MLIVLIHADVSSMCCLYDLILHSIVRLVNYKLTVKTIKSVPDIEVRLYFTENLCWPEDVG